jgi:type VI secretion system protein ImpG
VRNELLQYYERELSFLRQMGAEFADRYPKIASRLMLESNRCEDPHIERLLQGVALLAARLHVKLDDEFPEITQALLNIVFPHYTRPVPSMTIAELKIDPAKVRVSGRVAVPRESALYSKTVGGFACRFRTCYDTDLWPVRVVDAQWRTPDRLDPPLRAPEAVAAVRVELACWPEVKFRSLGLESLRFYLDGDSGLMHALYELLCNNCTEILLRNPKPGFRQSPVSIPPENLRPVGFADDEALLPYSRRSFTGYRLLQEYFAFPEKFFFVDVNGLDILQGSTFEDRLELIFLLSPYERQDRNELLELGVSGKTFRLGCTPIINLFSHTAEPIRLDHTRHEYPVIPDVRRPNSIEVYSIDQVTGTNTDNPETINYDPVFSFRHSPGKSNSAFFQASRQEMLGGSDGLTEMVLTLVDLSGQTLALEGNTLTVRCTCSNANLAARLPFGNEDGDFILDGSSTVHRVTAIRKPTPVLRYPLGRGTLWRLISHLSLNYLSLVEEGREALQEILRLYQLTPGSYVDQQIDGLTRIESGRHFARLVSENGISHVRGVRVRMELDEDKFVGAGVYLFASVLEHFLAQYVGLNSFSQLVLSTRQRKEVLREWSPRAGNRILL